MLLRKSRITTVYDVHVLTSIYVFVSLGANSILDLTSEEDSVHRYLFSDEGWAHLKSRYGYQYEDPVTILDDNNQAIRDIEKVSDYNSF